MPQPFVCACLTDTGLVRESNQDAFLVDEANGVFVIGDGLGGHNAGEVASAMAVTSVMHSLLPNAPFTDVNQAASALETAVQLATYEVWSAAQNDKSRHGMATTLVAAVICGSTLLIASVGDSRAYVQRVGRLVQMTEDHTWLQWCRDRFPHHTKEALEEVIGRKKLHSMRKTVGGERQIEGVDITAIPIRRGDRVLLCTDGITNMLPDSELRIILQDNAQNPVVACNALVQAANAAGGKDNSTAVVLFFHGTDLTFPTPQEVAGLARVPFSFGR